MSLEFVLLSTLLFLLLATGGRRLALVKLCDDGLRNVLKLLLLRVVVLRVGLRVVLKPLDCSVNCSLHLFLLFIGELASKLLLIINLVLEPIGIRSRPFLASTLSFIFLSSSAKSSASLIIRSISSGFNLFLHLLIFISEELSILDHTLNILRLQPVLVIGNCDLLAVTSGLIFSRHLQDTIGINLEGNFNLRNATRSRWNSSQVKLTENMVGLGHWPLTLKHLNGDSVLVVLSSGESLGLLGGDDGVTGDQLGHHTSNSFNSKGEGVHIQKNEVTGVFLSRQDTSLHSSSVCDSLIRVDASGWLLSIEEFLDKLLDLGNTSGSTNKHNLVDFIF